MKKILLMLLAITSLASFYSCSSDESDTVFVSTITQKSVVLQDSYTDTKSTGLEKTLLYIDEYNEKNDLLKKTSVVKFTSKIDDCPAEIIQSTELNSNTNFSTITQEITTYCRVNTSYIDDYIPSPDYLSRHYTRNLIVARQEILSTVIRRSSGGKWSEWTYSNDYNKTSSNHGKNIAFFGGSFAHNLRDGGKGVDRFGFEYNGVTISLQNLISDVFASKHIGNYAQGGQGVYTGTLSQSTSTPFFKYNIYEQIKYAFEFSQEKGYEYDVFLLFGGINDCSVNIPIGHVSDPSGDYSYIASFKKAIELIKSNNPSASIYLLTSFPVFHKSSNYNSLENYVDATIKLAEYYDIPLFDIYNYHIFTDENYVPYFMSDNIHPNGEGYRVFSSYILDFINSNQ